MRYVVRDKKNGLFLADDIEQALGCPPEFTNRIDNAQLFETELKAQLAIDQFPFEFPQDLIPLPAAVSVRLVYHG